MNTQLVILAAGKGTRMNSSLPKVLIGFKGKPLIQHLLDNTKEFHSAKKPIIVVGHRYELVQGYLGANYIYAFQQGQLGTGHAVLSSKSQVDAENVLILYGDMPFIKASSVQSLLDLHELKKSKFSMFVTNLPSFEKEFSSFLGFGRIIRDSNKNILQIKEFVDATDEEKLIKEVNPGIYIFNAKWLWEN
ncbi:MAG: NTP transferase domain-containing protein, partial [bacterium]|nr:NTP transferase domain-containing protein [bacterium]